MAELVKIGGHERHFGATHRTDNWWRGPMLFAGGFLAFVVYTTWALLQGEHYYAAPYLSPFYAPPLFTDPSAPGAVPVEHTWFGVYPAAWLALKGKFFGFLGDRWIASPAALILMFPLSFRMTCYYYRKSLYRAFALTPPACAVQGVREGKYNGETRLLLFQNLHRFAMYFAVVFVVLLGYDALLAFFKDGKFGVGVGTLVLVVNVVLIGGYTFGCHSFRHLIGGRHNEFTCGPGASVAHRMWLGCTKLNGRHMAWALVSMVWVGLSDLYVRLCSMGVLTDLNTWN